MSVNATVETDVHGQPQREELTDIVPRPSGDPGVLLHPGTDPPTELSLLPLRAETAPL
jgi:hypothetical protein